MKWTEEDATNFITGMGGFLQNILFGFVGLRLRKDKLELNPRLPYGSSGIHVKGLHYHGTQMDIFVKAEEMLINVLSIEMPNQHLKLFYRHPETIISLTDNVHVRFNVQYACIYDSSVENSPVT